MFACILSHNSLPPQLSSYFRFIFVNKQNFDKFLYYHFIIINFERETETNVFDAKREFENAYYAISCIFGHYLIILQLVLHINDLRIINLMFFLIASTKHLFYFILVHPTTSIVDFLLFLNSAVLHVNSQD